LSYQGALRLPADEFGVSSLNYSDGVMAYNPDRHSIYIVGHAHHQAVAEFSLPDLVDSSVLSELNMGTRLQDFASILSRASGGNPQALNRVGGLEYVHGPNGPMLLVNGYEFYDAETDNSHTTAVVRDADNLSGSTITGYYSLQGAAHLAGWFAPVPPEWQ